MVVDVGGAAEVWVRAPLARSGQTQMGNHGLRRFDPDPRATAEDPAGKQGISNVDRRKERGPLEIGECRLREGSASSSNCHEEVTTEKRSDLRPTENLDGSPGREV